MNDNENNDDEVNDNFFTLTAKVLYNLVYRTIYRAHVQRRRSTNVLRESSIVESMQFPNN